jgi:hypothetical protein
MMMITNHARSACEIKSRIVIVKSALDKKKYSSPAD